MATTPATLTPAQLRAAALAVRGVPGVQIAATIGVRPETVSRWKALPQFQAEIGRLVELGRKGDLSARAEALAGPALDALAAALGSHRSTVEVRVQAASALLAFAAVLGRRDPAPAGGEPAP
jgi:hypothetical protein